MDNNSVYDVSPTTSQHDNRPLQDSSTTLEHNNTNASFYESTTSAPTSPATLTPLQIAYIVAGTLGIIGNALSLIVIAYHKPLRRKLQNYFIINQCLLDLLCCVLLICFMFITIQGPSDVSLCYLWQSRVLVIGFYEASIYCIVTLAAERYLEVVHPIVHRLRVSHRKVVGLLVSLWFAGPLYKMAFIWPPTAVVNGTCNVFRYFPSPAASKAAGLVNLAIEFFIPILLISYFYIAMARSLVRRVQPRSVEGTGVTTPRLSSAKRNITLTLIVVVSCFVLCNVYKQMIIFLVFIGAPSISNAATQYNIAQLLSNSSNCFYPYIYFTVHAGFKGGLRKMFGVEGPRGVDTQGKRREQSVAGSLAGPAGRDGSTI